MIDEKILIERLEKRMRMNEMYHNSIINNGIVVALGIINDLASEHNNGWISVEDKLPEDFKAVFITAIALNGTSYTEVGKWNGNEWFHGATNTRIDIAEVIAWQPLPPVWKGEK